MVDADTNLHPISAGLTLVLGGSFDPVHLAHVACARSAAAQTGAKRVLLIPAWRSPFKTAPGRAGALDRLAMCRLAVQGEAMFDVSEIELDRGRALPDSPSYTFDTAQQLAESGDIAWLVGTDHLPKLAQWHRFEELKKLVRLVVMRRAGETIDRNLLPESVREIASDVIDVPSMAISSTDIRDRISTGRSITGMVHPDVEKFITDRGMYR